MRVRVEQDPARLVLETPVVSFIAPDKPRVIFVGVVHLAEGDYYERLQRRLDRADAVLFEMVAAARPHGPKPELSPEARDQQAILSTRLLLAQLSIRVLKYRKEHGTLPSSLADATGRMPTADAWGHPIEFTVAGPEEFTLRSLGADGREGGDGAAADLIVPEPEAARAVTLSDAFGWKPQSLQIQERWIHADLTEPELLAIAERCRVPPGVLGEIFKGGYTSVIERASEEWLRQTPVASAMLEAALVVRIGTFDPRTLNPESPTGRLIGALGRERNQRLVETLRRTLGERPEAETIAIAYGALHLVDLAERLRAEGFAIDDVVWEPAITAELGSAGVPPEIARMIHEVFAWPDPDAPNPTGR